MRAPLTPRYKHASATNVDGLVPTNALVLTGLVTLRVVGDSKTVRVISELPLRSAEHFAVTPVFWKTTRVDLMFARKWDPFSEQGRVLLGLCNGRTLLNQNHSNRLISDRPEVRAEPGALLRSTHVASEWPVNPPDSMPSAEISSYKPTSRYLS
jgi:hypothetical protein